MNILTFLIEVIATLMACLLITRYLRTPLKRMFAILCGTEEGAHFWTAFSDVVLVGLPVIISLTYRPDGPGTERFFFEVIGRLSGNLAAYLFTLITVGMITGFFVLVTPKPAHEEKK